MRKPVHIRLSAALLLLLMALVVAPLGAFHECGHVHEPVLVSSNGPALDEDRHCAMCDMVPPDHKATTVVSLPTPPTRSAVMGSRFLVNNPLVAAVALPCRGPPAKA